MISFGNDVFRTLNDTRSEQIYPNRSDIENFDEVRERLWYVWFDEVYPPTPALPEIKCELVTGWLMYFYDSSFQSSFEKTKSTNHNRGLHYH